MPSDSPDRIYLQWHGDQEPGHCNGEPGEVTWSKDVVYRHDIEYRRYDGPSPEVLMRALQIAVADPRLHDTFDPIGKCLDKAEAEIEAETKGGAK